ncbi:MAG: hypothetical protein C6Y22_19490 [Hapalosiphonaceae cyanobacterium JJU2]|nr:MAG: hypothetical protein C6Y22_19490 [Hapalosiphonaceae cyanobacterium JJU2]
MQSFKLGFVVFASVGLLFLGACSNQASESNSSPSVATSETSTNTGTTANSETSAHGDSHGKNAQVVEAGKYHLELVPEKEANATHLDFYLQTGDKHEAVTNAKVTADVQSPDGKQKTVPLSYDASGKHYTAKLDGSAAGQYQVKITADVGGEKVNGRFSFNQ